MGSFGKLYIQVRIGVAIGILLGYAEPQLAISLKPVGDAFIKAIKLMVAPIVFTTVVAGIATMGNIRRVASVGLRAIMYFEIASTLALIVGIVVGNIWPVDAGINIDPKAVGAPGGRG
jgi:aerobic C4-dicarboxylate transport protein